MQQDPYKILGIDPQATAAEIQTVYRRLALEFHPDRNPGSEAQQRFSEITWAHALLIDPLRRRLFDEFGPASLSSGFDPFRARAASLGLRPLDVVVVCELDAQTAQTGGSAHIVSPVGQVQLMVTIPAGAVNGKRIRLPGRGHPAPSRGRPGDLYVEFRIR